MSGRTVSREVARAALLLALTRDHGEEADLKGQLQREGIIAAAVDYGGEFIPLVRKIVERAVVAGKREGLIKERHAEEGAIAGATHDALSQLANKAMGLNIGGKIGMARQGDHLAVAIYCGIGLLHLDDVAIGLSHRAVT